MPRRPRCEHPRIPQHVIQRSAPSRQLFKGRDDAETYLSVLSEACIKQGCDLHAYALVTREVRLLLTGNEQGAVTAALHVSAQQYARYANARDQSRGPLWHGRYQSCLVGGMKYVLDAYQLVEQAARGEGASRPPAWSSRPGNAHGEVIPWLTPHAAYVRLGSSDAERQTRYRKRVHCASDEDAASLVLHTQQGCPWGSERFLKKLALAMGEVPSPRPRGRPRKVSGGSLKCLSLFFLTSWVTVVQTL